MPDYLLSIVTHDRGTRWDDDSVKKPYHWALFLTPSNDTSKVGSFYQLRGMPGGFYYQGEERNVNLKDFGDIKEILEVGTVPGGKIGRLKQLLNTIKIVGDESAKWNCQNWSLEALDLFRLEGFVSDDYPNKVIQYWLREH